MGNKFNMRKLHNGGCGKILKKRVCMSLTADVAGETKVKLSSPSQSTQFQGNTYLNIYGLSHLICD